MAAKLLDESPAEGQAQVLQRLEAEIRNRMTGSLGSSITPLRVRVRRLWEHHYRVNVYAGFDGPDATITHSYFVVTDESGGVLTTVPAIRGPSPTHPPAVPRAVGKVVRP